MILNTRNLTEAQLNQVEYAHNFLEDEYVNVINFDIDERSVTVSNGFETYPLSFYEFRENFSEA